jgi:enamidase
MPENEVVEIVDSTDFFVEICSSGNLRMGLATIRAVQSKGAYHRVVVGTDTPGGTGVIPRGMLREIAFLASVGGVPPEVAVTMATGNVARAHGLAGGVIEEGKPADIVLLDRIEGSVGANALDSFAKGDLPAVSVVMIDGQVQVGGRSQQTPPPARPALMGGCC